MADLIEERVELARTGKNPFVICRLKSGWVVVGDALLKATGAYRTSYETLGNSEPALHTHILPRYMSA